MTPSQDDDHLAESSDALDDEPARSLIETTWFRVVLVFLGIAVVAAITLPYLLDYVSPPAKPLPIVKPSAPSAPPPSPPAATASTGAPPQTTPAVTPETLRVPTQPGAASVMSTPRVAPPTESTPAVEKPKPASAGKKSLGKAIGGASGEYWVQVGAFRDAETAKRVAGALRRDNFAVAESTTSMEGREAPATPKPAPVSPPSPTDRYDVYVSGAATGDLGAKLTAKGLSVETAADSVVLRPSLPLHDAVSLSKELAADGFKVQVKRVRSADGAPPPAPAPITPRETLHRVRVGAFPDRVAAVAVMRELEAKGYKPFIARGRE